MSEQEFFERLGVKAECTRRMCFARTSSSIRVQDALDDGKLATIEALKEMMVGKPKFARLRHRGRISATPYTVVEFKPGLQFGIGGLEHIRTEGEEVEVIVFRLS